MIFRSMFSRHWLLTTVLVVAGAAVCARLGIWQLDRLAQRRAFNAHITSVETMPPLDLNAEVPADLTGMEYRSVVVHGTYDFANQVALRNQYHDNAYGYHLLTPLLLDNGSAVMIDRGWIPSEGNDTPSGWSRYDVPGQVEVQGEIRLGETKPQIGGIPDPTLTPDKTRLDYWYIANLERIGQQVPHPLLPVYIQPNVDPADTTPPIPYQPVIELTEGPHFGYALQWFTFATILLVGYPFYLRKQLAGDS